MQEILILCLYNGNISLNFKSDRGFLSWVDVSVGKMVAQFPNGRLGPISVMCQNPQNAVLCLGHSKGTVTMWTPNMKEPAAKLLAHRQPVRAVAVDGSGTYLATAGVDRSLKIWDVRQFKCLQDYRIPSGASNLAFSGTGLLAASMGGGDGVVEIYKDACTKTQDHAYMRHRAHRAISNLRFAPYEDVLGVGHAGGISSLIVPGSGEPHFDALEANPYQTKPQRREAEVKALLEKISPELIAIDPSKVGDVNAPAVQETIEESNKKLFIKPRKVDFEPRYKMKGKSGTAKKFQIKKKVQEEEMRVRHDVTNMYCAFWYMYLHDSLLTTLNFSEGSEKSNQRGVGRAARRKTEEEEEAQIRLGSIEVTLDVRVCIDMSDKRIYLQNKHA